MIKSQVIFKMTLEQITQAELKLWTRLNQDQRLDALDYIIKKVC